MAPRFQPDPPSYYEVLGVAPSAGTGEIRRAYLERARRVHPDLLERADAAALGESERAMQLLNEAWRVLRDPVRRAAYDLGQGHRRPWPAGDGTAHAPDADDLRIDLHGADEYVAADLPEDDSRPSRLSDLALLLPAALVVLFAGCLAVGLMMGSAALLAVGFACLALAGTGFVLAPFLAMSRGRRQE